MITNKNKMASVEKRKPFCFLCQNCVKIKKGLQCFEL